MSKTNKKKLWALVKWVGGTYDKTFTAGINVEHIKNFDVHKFLTDEENDPEEVYVVEWHDKNKEPLGGWDCFNAMVIAVSGSLGQLNKKLSCLEGVKSPGPKVKPTNNDQNGENGIVDLAGDNNIVDDNLLTDNEVEPKKKKLTMDGSHKNLDPIGQISQVNAEKNDIVVLENGNKKPNQSDTSTSSQVTVQGSNAVQYITLDDFTKAMKSVADKFNELRNEPPTSQGMKKNSSVVRQQKKQKELGHEGSGVFITREQWDYINSKNTYTAMTTSLLVALFPPDVLIRSNFKGGKARNKGDKDNERHEALDSAKINVMKEAVKAKFPDTFKDGGFGTAINTKLAKMRSMKHKKDNEKKNADNESKQPEEDPG